MKEKHSTETQHILQITEKEKNILLDTVEYLTSISKNTDQRYPTIYKIEVPYTCGGKDLDPEEEITKTKKEIVQKLKEMRETGKRELVQDLRRSVAESKVSTFLKTHVKEVDRNDRGEVTYLKIVEAENPYNAIEYEVATGGIWFSRETQLDGKERDYTLGMDEMSMVNMFSNIIFTDTEAPDFEKRTLPSDILETWKNADAFLINGVLCASFKEVDNNNNYRNNEEDFGGLFTDNRKRLWAYSTQGQILFEVDNEDFINGTLEEDYVFTMDTHKYEKPITIQPLFTKNKTNTH